MLLLAHGAHKPCQLAAQASALSTFRVPIDIALCLAEAAGLARFVVLPLQAMFRQLQRRFRFDRSVGATFNKNKIVHRGNSAQPGATANTRSSILTIRESEP